MKDLTIEEQIKIILKRRHMTIDELAAATGQTRQNIHRAFKKGSYDTDWLQLVADALDAELTITLEPNKNETK